MNQDQAWKMFLDALAAGDGPCMQEAMDIIAVIIKLQADPVLDAGIVDYA